MRIIRFQLNWVSPLCVGIDLAWECKTVFTDPGHSDGLEVLSLCPFWRDTECIEGVLETLAPFRVGEA